MNQDIFFHFRFYRFFSLYLSVQMWSSYCWCLFFSLFVHALLTRKLFTYSRVPKSELLLVQILACSAFRCSGWLKWFGVKHSDFRQLGPNRTKKFGLVPSVWNPNFRLVWSHLSEIWTKLVPNRFGTSFTFKNKTPNRFGTSYCFWLL